MCVCACVCVCVAGGGRRCEGYCSGRSTGGTGMAHQSTESGKGRASLVWAAVVVSLGLLPGHPQGPSSILSIFPGLLLMEGDPPAY